MNILIVGVGLIGGSFSLALKDRSDLSFAGFDLDQEALLKAKKIGLVDEVFSEMNSAVKWADGIVLAIPVKAIKELLPVILDKLESHQFVVDFGSTKNTICETADSHEKRDQFIAAHPIAGTEHSGPDAAFKELFVDKNLILCDAEKTDLHKLMLFEDLAKSAGFYLTKMSAKEHDRHLAYISHLSHITSYVLSNTVLNKEKDGEVILDLAGSGFESTVRLAKSSPRMWSSIFLENKEMVLKGIVAYKKELEQLETLIENNEEDAIEEYLEEGRVIRKILK
ncbi:MAG: prephenate dehydrogenase [Ekhidna sp.]